MTISNPLHPHPHQHVLKKCLTLTLIIALMVFRLRMMSMSLGGILWNTSSILSWKSRIPALHSASAFNYTPCPPFLSRIDPFYPLSYPFCPLLSLRPINRRVLFCPLSYTFCPLLS